MANEESLGTDHGMTLHFNWAASTPLENVLEMLTEIEQIIAPFKPRPHWVKVFTLSPTSYLPLYKKRKEFKELADELDPNGRFRNQFLAEKVFA